MLIDLPYGSGMIQVVVPENSRFISPRQIPCVADLRRSIRAALDNPIGCEPIRVIARGKKDAVIVINDTTRPAPSGPMLEEILIDLAEAGISEDAVTVIIACGNHMPNTQDEIRQMVGEDLLTRLRIINHDCNDREKLSVIGKTETGIPIWVNKAVADSSFKITTGLITPHHSAGYSGGRKSIIPGVAGLETLKMHHSFPIRPYEPAYGWMKGNPFHEEALRIARDVGVDFILNVVQTGAGDISMVVAGELEAAHEKGIEACKANWELNLSHRYDVVIVAPGGYPRDIDLHQSQKAMSSAEMIVEKDGVIVLIAECRNGIGKYADWLKKAETPREVIERFQQEGFNEDHSSKAFMCARALERYEVIVHCSGISDDELKQMFFTPVSTPQDAIDRAMDSAGSNARVLVLPYAVNCVPKVAKENTLY